MFKPKVEEIINMGFISCEYFIWILLFLQAVRDGMRQHSVEYIVQFRFMGNTCYNITMQLIWR